jgi:hypothetical protein
VSAIRLVWKRPDGFIAFFPCPGSGLAGRPSSEEPPDLPFAGLQSALGSLPSVALSSAEGVFPVSLSLGVYRRGKGNGWCLQGSIELIASAIVSDHAGLG